jgi:hypothetical protein
VTDETASVPPTTGDAVASRISPRSTVELSAAAVNRCAFGLQRSRHRAMAANGPFGRAECQRRPALGLSGSRSGIRGRGARGAHTAITRPYLPATREAVS